MNTAFGKSMEHVRHEKQFILQTNDNQGGLGRLREEGVTEYEDLCQADRKLVNYFPLIKTVQSIGDGDR